MTDNVSIGNQIMKLRKKNGYTQEELAEKLGITSQAVSKWENGHTLPETAQLPALSKILKSTIDDILMPNAIKAGDVIEFGKFKWRVLDIDGGKALILTDRVIEHRAFHGKEEKVTWENSDIRKYLNGEFFDKFSKTEKERVILTRVTDRDNPWYPRMKWGNDTDDKVFLLSFDEVVRYFGNSGDLEARRGKCEGIGLEHGDSISDEFNDARRVYDLNGSEAYWWLRSPGGPRDHTDDDHVTAGSVGNVIFLCGDSIVKTDGGVRPALWVSLE